MRTAQEPTDTPMRGIVHGALRHDLLRTRAALTGEPFPEGGNGGRSASTWRG